MAQANIKAVITAEDKASGTLKGFSDNVESMGSQVIGIAKKASLALVAGATAATTFAVKSAADFEQTRIGLENMLGSADRARGVLKEVSDFAAATPFQFPELALSVKQLVAFGFNAEDAVSTMKQLGDVSAAIGAPIGDLSYLMGTLKTQGRAFTRDIVQFAMRGIPIYEYLEKVTGQTGEALKAMVEEGKIGFPEVQKAFELMTAEGGKFHGTMAKQSKSLSGLFSTLKDTIGITAREMVGLTQGGDVRQGSLFDRIRMGAAWLIDNLPMLIQTLGSVAQQIADYLQPKLQALVNTFQEAMPTLTRLWQEVLQPLAVALGQTVVAAIGLLIDALNLLMTVLAPVFQWMLDHKVDVIAMAVAFGILAVAMNFNAIVAAFTGAMNTVIISLNVLRLVTIPGAMASLAQLAAGFSPVALAAVAAAALIIDAGNRAKAAWDATTSAVQSAANSNAAVIQNLQNLQRNGTPEQQERARITLKRLAETGSFASGGYTGVGGTNEVAGVVHKGEYVIPQSGVDQNTGLPKMSGQQTINITVQAGAFMGSQQDARQYARLIMDAWNDIQGMGTVRRTA